MRHSYATRALKAGINPKVVSERIGHADIGFFLQTYAHLLGNDDCEAAEQAASFLIGDGWDLDEEYAAQAMRPSTVPKRVPIGHETAPGELSEGRFRW
jgi:hypothetical protein